ncbi:GntR family transcriptional regulator [Streptomyces sp. NPDC005951]|uniref:GntR family transcriptional regulator n=1 Tax=Streptomyces sp. NPDC005951 TaxID=3154573 RepID=UPI0034066442
MTGPVPRRHHDIADDLRHQITTGSIKPGERLPSEAGLAARYRVSTVTLRRALAVLQGEGLVEKIHGKGNYVRHPRRKIMYVGGWGTLDPWTAAEPTLRITVRSTTVPASVHLTTLLKVPTGSPLAEYTCLSLEQGSPRGLACIYIPRDLAPAGVLDDDSVCREAATRFAVLGPAAAGLTDVTPHDLRASHGTGVADRYGVMTAAHRLGHSNASVTTRHYARPVVGRDEQVAEASDTWFREEGGASGAH